MELKINHSLEQKTEPAGYKRATLFATTSPTNQIWAQYKFSGRGGFRSFGAQTFDIYSEIYHLLRTLIIRIFPLSKHLGDLSICQNLFSRQNSL